MGKYASTDYELLKKQRAEGWTMDRLAQWHGVSRWTIAEWLRRGAHTPKQLGANQYTVYYWIREKGITYAERKMSEIA